MDDTVSLAVAALFKAVQSVVCYLLYLLKMLVIYFIAIVLFVSFMQTTLSFIQYCVGVNYDIVLVWLDSNF